MRAISALLIILGFVINAEAAIKIVVDPGHGGIDRGCIHGGVFESAVALSISKKLALLLQNDKQFTVKLLRNGDQDLSLNQRVEETTSFAGELFVSIHANSSPNSNVRGGEFYIQNQMPPEEEAKFLASRENVEEATTIIADPYGNRENIGNILFDLQKTQKILESYELGWYLQKHWPTLRRKSNDKMIRQGPFFVLSQNQITAVLIEVGYLSNAAERKELVSEAYQKRIAEAIYQGLKDYARNMDKVPSPALQL